MCLDSLLSIAVVLFMNVVAYGCSLFFCAVWNTVTWVYHSHLFIFIHCIIGGSLNDLFGAIKGKVAMIFLVCVSGACEHTILFGLYPEEELLAHRLCVSSTSADKTKLFSRVVVPVYSQQQGVFGNFPCSISLTIFLTISSVFVIFTIRMVL